MAGPLQDLLLGRSGLLFDFLVIAALIITGATQGVRGLSLRSALLYFMLLSSRYADALMTSQDRLIAIVKFLAIAGAGVVVAIFENNKHTQEPHKDTCSILNVLLPCMLLGFLSSFDWTTIEIFYSFSCVLEHFILVPQYMFCYRDVRLKTSTLAFVILRNVHRGYIIVGEFLLGDPARYLTAPHYHFSRWAASIAEVALFVDFLLRACGHDGALRSQVLSLDLAWKKFEAQMASVVGQESPEYLPSETGELRWRRKQNDSDRRGEVESATL
jgi:hypothetical protein